MRRILALSLAIAVMAAILPSASAGAAYSYSQAPACRDYLHIATGVVYQCASPVALPFLGPLPGVERDSLSERFLQNGAYAEGDYMPFSDQTCGRDVCIDANVGLIGEHCLELFITETMWDAEGSEAAAHTWKLGPFCNWHDLPLTYLRLFGIIDASHGCKLQVETRLHLDGVPFGAVSSATYDGC